MSRLLIVLSAMILALSLSYGCGKKETEKPGKVPTEVKEAEMKDTTRMDTAATDTGKVDTAEVQQDTM
ncbi:MAG: hypothetical protein ACE5K8_01945 [Candidatus Zixiibacteriota bacterium]